MELAQILPDGGISATWIFGIMTMIIGYFIVNKLNSFEKVLQEHSKDIEEVKLAQVEAKVDARNIYQRLEKMDDEFNDLMKLVQSKMRYSKGE